MTLFIFRDTLIAADGLLLNSIVSLKGWGGEGEGALINPGLSLKLSEASFLMVD